MNLKSFFESDTKEEKNFAMKKLYGHVFEYLEKLVGNECVSFLKNKLQKKYPKFVHCLIRSVFLIELVKTPKIETTKVRVRWFPGLKDDPRFCTFEECLEIYKKLMLKSRDWLNDENNLELLKNLFETSVLPYEIPIDYEKVPESGSIHTLDNINWISDFNYMRDIRVRYFLLKTLDSNYARFFDKVLKDKVKVKTYLTDRVLTGDYKTNREKRWETHPKSVHFALRRTCADIEYKLMSQIFDFKNFPDKLTQKLKEKGLVQEKNVALCPITGMELDFTSFKKEVEKPVHGKSAFQVGHLVPLKLSQDLNNVKHEASNISWVSADGNRIQGSLSVKDTIAMIKQIYSMIVIFVSSTLKLFDQILLSFLHQ